MIITLDDLVKRDGERSAESWILALCVKAVAQKKISRGWDGTTVSGEPVLAFINSGRWLARCKVCGNLVYVTPSTPLAYCPECGNGGSQAAWPVEFPVDREEIEQVLLAREVVVPAGRLVRNEIEEALNARPVIPGLARNWRPGITAAELRAENEMATNQRGAKK